MLGIWNRSVDLRPFGSLLLLRIRFACEALLHYICDAIWQSVACVTTAKLELQFAISEILQKIRMERFAANSRYATKITSLEGDIQQQPACWVPLRSTCQSPPPKKQFALFSRLVGCKSGRSCVHDAHDAHVNHLSSCSSRPVFWCFLPSIKDCHI